MRTPLNAVSGPFTGSSFWNRFSSENRSAYTKLDLEPAQDDGFSSENYSMVYQILQQSDQDILSILQRVLAAKPHLRKEFGEQGSSWFSARGRRNSRSGKRSARDFMRFSGDQPIDMDATPRFTEHDIVPMVGGNLPTVQFSASHYFVSESESTVECGIIRIGDLTGQAKVAYETFDIAGLAGKVYRSTKSYVMFQPGEAWQFFKIGIKENEEWDVTQVFGAKLIKEGTIGAQMSRSLVSTHIHVINDDAFPSNKYANEILSESFADIPPLGLLIEYLKLQWDSPPIKKGSIKLVVVGQMQNLYFMLKLFMQMYLLKNVLSNADNVEDDIGALMSKHFSLICIAAMTVIPFAVTHFLEWHKFEWKVGGMSRTILQKAILRKYLTCDKTAKNNLADGLLIMGISRDTLHLVSSGYMGFIAVLNTIGSLFVLCAFQFIAPIVWHLPPRASAFVPMLIFPVVLFFMVVCRNKATVDLLTDRNDQESDIVDKVVETTKYYQLIMDFDCRGRQMEDFQKEIGEFNLADMRSCQLLCNNAHFAPWITVLLLATYTYTGGCEVIRGDISLALYLTNVAVFTQLGAAYGHILTTCVEIQTSFPALLRITKLLNLPADDNQRMVTIRQSCGTSVKLVKEYAAQYGSNSENVPIDMLPIWVKDLSMTHTHMADRATGKSRAAQPNEIDPTFVFQGSVEMSQGRLISIIGPHSEGKSTLLGVLGGATLPDMTSIQRLECYVPCHLRVIHIPQDPCFFRGTLMDNMTYGVRAGDSDGNKTRVKAIFRHFDMPGQVINLLEEDSMHCSNWWDVLSVSQRHLLSIVRALVANPQVICVHKPIEKYSEEQGKLVLGVLKSFVEQSGLEQDTETVSKRKPRPRTCIMTNVNLVANDYADDVIYVSKAGMNRIDKHLVREDMIR
jgi:ABC-type multidrug transport system fused ATPase/permease subunit